MTRFYKLISVIFHPILLPIVATILYFILHQTNLETSVKYKILIIVATATYLIPLFLLFILKRKKMIQSFEVKNIQERKTPIVFMIVLFYFLGQTLSNIPEITLVSILFFGCSLSLSICYFLFLKKIKTSLHMIGIGSLISFIITYSIHTQTNLLNFISFLSLIAGLIGHARLYLKSHVLKEVIIGFSIGFISNLAIFINTFYLQP